MSLIWHIVRKDFSRLRWPLLLWLLLSLAHWTMLAKASRSMVAPAAFEGMASFSQTWIGLTWAIGLILAAWLVMEDGLVGTRAFWRTRPVRGARLLSAKVLGAILMFGVLPVLVMTPIWFANGFSLREWSLGATELFLKQAIFSVAAFTIACVTETAGQFLVRLIGAVIAVPLVVGYCAGLFGDWPVFAGHGLTETRYRLVMGVLVLAPLVLITHQYLTRRRIRSYGILGASVGLMLALRLGWQWDVTPFFRKFPAETPGQAEEFKFAAEQVTIERPLKRHPLIKLTVDVLGAPAGSLVNLVTLQGWWTEGTQHHLGARFSQLGAQQPLGSATCVLGGATATTGEPTVWTVSGIENEAALARAEAGLAQLQVVVSANLMRGRVVGELPLREGAVLRSGSSFTRVAGLERIEGRLVVSLEEREASPPWSVRAQDGFLVSIPAIGPESSYSPVAMNRRLDFASISLGQRQLSIPIPTREENGRIREIPGWEESTRIVKVRFTPEPTFTKILPVDLPPPAQP